MEITIKNGSYGDLIYKAENVLVSEDINETLYGLKEDGKCDYNVRLGRDVTDEILNKFSAVLEDLIYYRNREYDSCSLITQLFSKLSEETQQSLLKQLNEDYGV